MPGGNHDFGEIFSRKGAEDAKEEMIINQAEDRGSDCRAAPRILFIPFLAFFAPLRENNILYASRLAHR
jgi:hypothetical protein